MRLLLVCVALIMFAVAAIGVRWRRFHPGWAGLACWVAIDVIARWPK